jgi:hypothetical protein
MVAGAHGPSNLSGPPSGRPGTPREKLRLARGAPRRTTETPPRSMAGRPLGRNSASLEGYAHPRADLRLARGLCAPSGGFPPLSGLSRVRRSRTHSPDRSIKCSSTPRAPGSRTNPRHAGPLTPPGNHIPALFHRPLVRPSPPLYNAVW